MPPMNSPPTIWGRPTKPVALGLAWIMGVLAVFNVAGIGILGGGLFGHAIAALSAASCVALVAGWLARSQKMAEAGLVMVGAVYVARSSFLLMQNGWGDIGVYLGLGVVLIAWGSYVLERVDPRGRGAAV